MKVTVSMITLRINQQFVQQTNLNILSHRKKQLWEVLDALQYTWCFQSIYQQNILPAFLHNDNSLY